jgi:hypothetical protein
MDYQSADLEQHFVSVVAIGYMFSQENDPSMTGRVHTTTIIYGTTIHL